MGRTRTVLVLLAVAALLLAPSLVLGTVISHNSPHNLNWAAQFAEQFRAGVLYPRWMPYSYDGLGGPAFYFYSPLPFWVDGLVGVITFNTLPVSYRLALTSLLLSWASGLTMHAWLRYEAPNARTALLGAIAYMAAPYHLYDHYIRGGIAEFSAYAVLPLVILAIRLVADRRQTGILLLGLAYAVLVFSHLPTALLVSATIVPAYVLFRTWCHDDRFGAIGFVTRCACAGALGLGIAATYLLPVLLLQNWISADELWGPAFQVENWFVLRPGRWFEPWDMELISWLTAAYTVLAGALCITLLRMPGGDARRHELGFWIVACFVVLALLAGLVPWFWQLPEMAKVQFPWRLMVVVEFAAVTAFCLTAAAERPRAASLVAAAAILFATPALVMMTRSVVVRIFVTWNDLGPPPHDVREYMPARFPQWPGPGLADRGLEPLKGMPEISCMPVARICRAENERFGAMRIEIESDVPTKVSLRRFFFPSWRIGEAIAAEPTDPLRLVSFVAPVGRSDLRLHHVALPVDRSGWAISGLSLILLMTWSTFGWRVRRP